MNAVWILLCVQRIFTVFPEMCIRDSFGVIAEGKFRVANRLVFKGQPLSEPVSYTHLGYPQKYQTGLPIEGLDENGQSPYATVYHAGTKLENEKLVTSGGRVLGVTSTAPTLKEALEKSYRAVESIRFKGAHYRKDIGAKAL